MTRTKALLKRVLAWLYVLAVKFHLHLHKTFPIPAAT